MNRALLVPWALVFAGIGPLLFGFAPKSGGHGKKSTKAQAAPTPTKARPSKQPKAPAQPGGKPVFGSEMKLHWVGKGLQSKQDSLFSGDATALSSFALRFNSGDHRIRRVGVHRSEGRVVSEFSDRDADDSYVFDATFRALPGVNAKSTPLSKRCQVVCDVPIDKPKPGEVFVLTGFLFMRTDMARKVKRIAIRPDPARGVVRVEFDDGNGIAAGSVFKPQIEYAYVPQSHVAAQHTGSSVSESGELSVVEGDWGDRVLQGFDLQFVDGGRFVRELRVGHTHNRFAAALRDRNARNQVAGSVDTVTLRR